MPGKRSDIHLSKVRMIQFKATVLTKYQLYIKEAYHYIQKQLVQMPMAQILCLKDWAKKVLNISSIFKDNPNIKGKNLEDQLMLKVFHLQVVNIISYHNKCNNN